MYIKKNDNPLRDNGKNYRYVQVVYHFYENLFVIKTEQSLKYLGRIVKNRICRTVRRCGLW